MTTRYYFALTNLCNRACELCSCHSDPTRSTHLPFDDFARVLEQGVTYEAQLEGGEPTVHPEFWRMVLHLAHDPLCKKVILCTNAVKIPDSRKDGRLVPDITEGRMQEWLGRFSGKPFLLKPSINSHLLERDGLHLEKMSALLDAFNAMRWSHPSQILFNVRRRPPPLSPDGDEWLATRLKQVGLYEHCCDFEYQRYGRAEGEEVLARPFIVANPVPFFLISPDGRNFGKDLIGRANHMEKLG